MSSVVGLLAPSRTPEPIIRKIAAEVADILKEPATRETLKTLGTEPFVLPTPRDYATYLQKELDRWGRTIKAAAIEVK
jgi:tripartite-type tricarboxylate transporter receptor subunit TctC